MGYIFYAGLRESTSEPLLRQVFRICVKRVEAEVTKNRSLCWLRRDLRIHDSAALSEANANGSQAAVGFVWDDHILSHIKDKANRRVTYIHRSLREIDENLKKVGSRLVVRRGDPLVEIPKLARELEANHVVWGEDYDPSAIARDQKVKQVLKEQGIDGVEVKDIVIFAKDEVQSAAGSPFRVYSPYARAWNAAFQPEKDACEHHVTASQLIKEAELPKSIASWDLHDLGFENVELWLTPGEAAGHKRLKEFSHRIDEYAESRNFPATDGTSHLSVDFRFGTVSIRSAVRECLKHKNEGARKWLAELVWRDFYQDILFHFPQVVTEPFQPEFKDIKYPGTEKHWELWRDGQTGFPIVDAAMRCLNATGYMHNRLRMVVASFLSKDLLLEYKQGEQWFARQLLDYELASNNGGWQWASSVGCDPQPYFRIFNPVLQSEKFDPDGIFIKKWVPELDALLPADIHFPANLSQFELEACGVRLGENYPKPCVDHKVQRVKAISLLEQAKKSGR